ncbi:8-oxo-dGTP diphosphatase MutT [Geitlerinema sp. PCC 9228]|jgi:mutator protein MutT|uniref:8-oxo-dGTP diphosphatase MutT n=1 Tax=Geitlerinema sp. PCC 9228 TaxID=111611 RepID=UPI0008F9CA4F|nr:8-oxo-dGTP diphosphatase MutT [Geitlerinema sp. PCC 9228]
MTEAAFPHKYIGVAVIWNQQNQILIDRRRREGEMGGLWEFPGGKIESGETYDACIRREIREELGIDVRVGDRLVEITHTYDTFRVTLVVHHCHHVAGRPQALECEEIRWVHVEQLHGFAFPEANLQIINALQKEQSA